MSQIPTPPASRPGSEAPEAKAKPVGPDLVQSLDSLLEQYLDLLDKQQKLQTGLSKHLSSVCLLIILLHHVLCDGLADMQ
jgi:hypothetical protein